MMSIIASNATMSRIDIVISIGTFTAPSRSSSPHSMLPKRLNDDLFRAREKKQAMHSPSYAGYAGGSQSNNRLRWLRMAVFAFYALSKPLIHKTLTATQRG